jgi:hypothetical protein
MQWIVGWKEHPNYNTICKTSCELNVNVNDRVGILSLFDSSTGRQMQPQAVRLANRRLASPPQDFRN